jgi:hypothetical protein
MIDLAGDETTSRDEFFRLKLMSLERQFRGPNRMIGPFSKFSFEEFHHSDFSKNIEFDLEKHKELVAQWMEDEKEKEMRRLDLGLTDQNCDSSLRSKAYESSFFFVFEKVNQDSKRKSVDAWKKREEEKRQWRLALDLDEDALPNHAPPGWHSNDPIPHDYEIVFPGHAPLNWPSTDLKCGVCLHYFDDNVIRVRRCGCPECLCVDCIRQINATKIILCPYC